MIDPETTLPFGDAGAWELIADRLEAGEELTEIELQKPRGKKAYVMKIPLAPNSPRVYVKLQLGAGKVIARSFHVEQ